MKFNEMYKRMSFGQRVLVFTVLPIIIGLGFNLLPGCSTSDNNAQLDRRLDALEQSVKDLGEDIDRLDIEKADVPPPQVERIVPSKSPTHTIPKGLVDQAIEAGDLLKAMPDVDCAKVDAFHALGLDRFDERRSDDGSEFYYDCVSGYWGWYFDGSPSDVWTLNPVDVSEFGIMDTILLPLDRLGAPLTNRHPQHPDALTAAELYNGQMVCMHGRYDGTTVIVGKVGVHARNFGTNGIHVYGGFTEDLPKATDNVGTIETPYSLEDMGVIPNQFGKWSRAWVSAGACQNDPGIDPNPNKPSK